MLTDDDLTRELGESFRMATADLAYRGRTRPPMRMTSVLPATAATAVLVAVTIGTVHASDHHGASTGPFVIRPTTTGPATIAQPAMKTETMKLAGFTLTYQHAAGTPDPLYAEFDFGGLPAGVRKVPLTGTKARAWIGKDPKSGDNALYVKAPTRNGRRLFALVSPTWSQKRLVAFFKQPQPSAVPLVKSGRGGSHH